MQTQTIESVESLVSRGWQLRQKIQNLEQELETVNQELHKLAHNQTLPVPGKPAVCILTEQTRRSIEEPKKLLKILGERFADLVLERTTYRPTERLLQIAKQDTKVQACIKEVTSPVTIYQFSK